MPGSKSGFTLIEVTIVLSVMAIALGLATPGLFTTWEKAEFQKNLNKIVFFLRESQLEAVSKAQKVSVVLDISRREFSRGDGRRLTLPDNLNIEPRSDKTYTKRKKINYLFYPGGKVVGTELLVTGKRNRNALIYIEPLTGRAKCALR